MCGKFKHDTKHQSLFEGVLEQRCNVCKDCKPFYDMSSAVIPLFAKFAEKFSYFTFSAPSATMPPTTCEVNEIKIDKTTQICIIWPKPPGGDVINNYYVQWTIDGSFTFSSTVNFNQNNFGIYVITNLSPGIIVTIIIYANNGGGNGDPSPPTDIPTCKSYNS